ncbi:carbohydrate kinase family protein [Candidatus Nomurabacteria bacterium]|nr:carbohydrate kinase family protein [Candidatus Nomurabacteria bacterium]
MSKIDFLAIGDTVVDAFIKIKEAQVLPDTDGMGEMLCMSYADKIPYESIEIIPAVGNSANAAVSASRLGLSSGLISNLGKDENGKLCLDVFKKEKVDTKLISIEENKITNFHYVLWYDKDRTILIKHEIYDYKLPKFPAPKWIYLSSLGEQSLHLHLEIENYLKENPDVKLAFQPGTFQMKFGYDKIKGIYERSNIFFCNVEEAQKILGITERDVKGLLRGISNLGPQITVITDGPNGVYVFDKKNYFFLAGYPDQKPAYERTGAGDAFSSTFTVAIILGRELEDALKWASLNAVSIVQQVGAQKGLLTRPALEQQVLKARKSWKMKKI